VDFSVKGDLLIHCGDLIDRGPNSIETFNFFTNDTTGSFISLRGNHEKFLIDSADTPYDLPPKWVCNNGGEWALSEDPITIKSMAEVAKTLPIYLTLEYHKKKYGFVHAEVSSEFKSWEAFTKAIDADTTGALTKNAVWGREIAYGAPCEPLTDIVYSFHGHSVLSKPTFFANRLYLDTGFVYGQLLTLVQIHPNTELNFKFRDQNGEVFFTSENNFIIAR